MPNEEKETFLSKIVILGESEVGKTSLRRKYMGKSFQAHHLATLGADFSSIEIKINKNVSLEAQIWDIAGQPAFEKLRTRFLTNATGAILVFDITRLETFNEISTWLDELMRANDKRDIPLMVIGNKLDLGDDREVPISAIEQYIEDLGNKEPIKFNFVEYIETSAKTGENVVEGFEKLARGVFKYQIQSES